MSPERIEYLLKSYLERTSTAGEEDEFFSLLQEQGYKEPLNENLLEFIKNIQSKYTLSDKSQAAIMEAILNTEGDVSAPATGRGFRKGGWLKYAAAVLLIVTGTTYFWSKNNGNSQGSEVHAVLAADKKAGPSEKEVSAKINKTTSIAAGTNKAILTLADGTTIVLDGASNGVLAHQGGIKVLKLNTGALAYNTGASDRTGINEKPIYNTISTPRGGQYQLILGDGTKVWLNAASSLRFPISFTGNSRKVEVTGEAYFEIATDRSKPFTVTADSVSVEVLGTSFNVNAYPDESSINTTLVDGAVRINVGKKTQLLTPGQQALVKQKDASLKIVDEVEVERMTAWKDGSFVFNDTPIEVAMRQLARWYNVEVVYEGTVPEQAFNGVLSRSNSLDKVLKVLELSDVHFRMEERKIIVMP